MYKIAINGFGRIGRCVTRIYSELEGKNFEIVVINSNKIIPAQAAHMLKYDSVHGRMEAQVNSGEDFIEVNGEKIKIIGNTTIDSIDWNEFNIDMVLECTGSFNEKSKAITHIHSGAKKVIVSAPCKDSDLTLILGVNDADLFEKNHEVISVGSCTTNCLAPIVKIINDRIGIERAFMTTIHAYTNDQNILDSRHTDWRRGRAAAMSMIPTSTGAAKMIGKIIPSLDGKIDGIAVRVPVANVSMIDLSFVSSRETSVDEINNIVIAAAQHIPTIVGINYEELVSIDFNHTIQSAIFDINQTRVVDEKLCRVVAWYDNEWGFANRMVDICKMIAEN